MPNEGRGALLSRLAIGAFRSDPSGALTDVDEVARTLLGLQEGARPEWLCRLAQALRASPRASTSVDQGARRLWVTAARDDEGIEGIVQEASVLHAGQLFDDAPVAMHSIDRDARIRDVNRKWLELTGYERHEVVGRDMSFVLTAESSRRATEETIPRFWRDGHVRMEPHEFVRKNGGVVEVEVDCDVATDAQGQLVSISVVRDVTARNRALRALEERERDLRSLIERTPDAVLLHRDDVIVFANPAAAALLGVARESELEGEPLPAALRGDPTGAQLVEARVTRRDGSERLVEVHRFALSVSGARTEAALARDLTERRELQAQLAQADRLSTIGMLAAAIAHEVNNPLTFVTHFVSLLRRDLDGLPEDGVEPERRERLLDSARTISEGLARVREIVRGLKTFARVDEDGPVPLDVNRALRSAIQLASHPIGMRARLTVELGALPIVRANDGQLCQVFLNLLLNAGQAIPEGAPDEHEVRVRSWSDGAQVYVTFEDSGTGIDPRHLPRLFEPFFTTKRRNVGSGLGLWISREIVHDVGGHLEVESRTGGGSTFTVVLPASSARTLAITTSTAPPPPGSLAALPSSAKVRRVLVVDDEPALRSLLADALSEKAHVVTASSGREARDLLEHDDAFDAILCDVLMPGMSGPELYDWVREHAPALRHRVVFMTGDAYAPSVRGFLSKVTNSTLHKPFRVREVESVLDELYTAQERARS